MIGVENKLTVVPFQFDLRSHSISIMTVEIDFLNKKR